MLLSEHEMNTLEGPSTGSQAYQVWKLTFLFPIRSGRIRSGDQITCEHESSLGEHPAGKAIVHVRFVTFMSFLELDLSTLAESSLED